MKVTMTGTMSHEGKEIHFLTLKRGPFVYEFWPSPFNTDDIRYSVTRVGDKALEILGLAESEPVKSGSLLR